MSKKRQRTTKPGKLQQREGSATEATAMEKAQEDAAKERQSERGYQ
jgi:hypothetical protein